MAIRVRVISKLHQGYHRAGQAIAPGESELVVSDLQCAALEGDPRLVVVRLAEDVAHPESAPDASQAAGDLDDATLGGVSTEPGSPAPEVAVTTPVTASGKGKGK
ncbi:HI1506-related protein [Aeromonas dhakensis]|uniref:HI1506-related protein n=1 Tax=Aeromonas dhakensis TaxID=196024 RepID=UPI00259E6252|nr:HI1506-related protein [Aeromonas dhakensis]MDM5054441.1 HI1506-related protein [Aeromonas dhakensis]MDM5080704.1 HI1506-related protein [Aeromonas dhakensis]